MKTTETFYRLTEEEKERLIEQCREELEDEDIRDTERIREVLEELLETWDKVDLQYWQTRAWDAESEERSLRTQLDTEKRETEKIREENDGLKEQLAAVKTELNESSAQVVKDAGKVKHTVEKMERLEQRLAEYRAKTARRHFYSGLLTLCAAAGLFLAAAGICVSLFPVQYVTDAEVLPEENAGVNGWYTGGVNVNGQFSGHGSLLSDDGLWYRGFWLAGRSVMAWEYTFPGGGSYFGIVNGENRPGGLGTFTTSDGEEIFGYWSWALEKTVTVGEQEYSYTGTLRFGKPYGCGVFENLTENSRYVGEFYEDNFYSGTWTEQDGTVRTVAGN